MCGRYALHSPGSKLATAFAVQAEGLQPRYNIAPTQKVAAVRAGSNGRELFYARWGLVPPWAVDEKMASRLINARAETVAEKPSFRSALRHRRCLILADGFFEWRREGKGKQPYYITFGGEPFAFAGMFEHWQGKTSCAIITTAANGFMRPLHDRMPVILDPADYDAWIEPVPKGADALLPLLKAYPGGRLRAWPVDNIVNSPHNDTPACIEPLQQTA